MTSEIQSIHWPDSQGGGSIVSGEESGRLFFDQVENWIIQIKDGKKVASHNPRYVDTIIWKLDQ